jgi:hypothetical protein
MQTLRFSDDMDMAKGDSAGKVKSGAIYNGEPGVSWRYVGWIYLVVLSIS